MCCRILNLRTGDVFIEKARRANSLLLRLRGLAGAQREDSPAALWLIPCNGIHTFGMRFPLDVIVLDRSMRVRAVFVNVKPNRIVLPVSGGFSTVELPSGSARLPEVGDPLAPEE